MAYINNEMITNSLNGQPVHDILNAIWDEADNYYQRNVTRATLGNIKNTGDGINVNPALQNQFLNLLMTQVVMISMSSPELKNDFSWAVKQQVPYGKTVEEVATDVIDPIEFDEYLAEFREKEIFKPNVATRFYAMNREDQFPVTVSKPLMANAFENEESFMNFYRGIINTLISSDERSKYMYTMALIEDYHEKQKFTIVEAPDVLNGTDADASKLIEEVNTHVLNMSVGQGTRKYNNQGFVRRTETDQVRMVITTRLLSRLKLGVWAKVFNLTEAELKPRIQVVDEFPNHPEIQAVVLDPEMLQIFPNYKEMTAAQNNRGLYFTYYLNVFETYAMSDFKNGFVITSSTLDTPVYDVIIPLSSTAIRRGEYLPYYAIVKHTDDKTYTPTFSVAAPEGSNVPLSSGTKFDGNKLYVDKLEKNSLLTVTATVKVGTGETAKEIKGTAIAQPVK